MPSAGGLASLVVMFCHQELVTQPMQVHGTGQPLSLWKGSATLLGTWADSAPFLWPWDLEVRVGSPSPDHLRSLPAVLRDSRDLTSVG